MFDKKNKMKDLKKKRDIEIIIQKKVVSADEHENQKKDWSTWKTVWAERNSLFGEAYYAARAINQENTVEYTLRRVGFTDEINTKEYRIKEKLTGKVYKIDHVDDLKNNPLFLKIKCLEGDPDE